MDPEKWLLVWENNRINFHQKNYNSKLVEIFPTLGIGKDEVVFVPLCGKSLDMLWLVEQGHRVIGVELSEIAVAEFFKENNLEHSIREQDTFKVYQSDKIKIYLGNIFDLQSDDLKEVAGVYDRAAIVALSQEMRRQYAEKIKEICPVNCKFYIDTIEYDQSKVLGPPFSVTSSEIEKLFSDKYRLKVVKSEVNDALSPKFKGKVEKVRRSILLSY